MRFIAAMYLVVGLIGCVVEEEPRNRPPPSPCTPGAVRCVGTVIQTCGTTRLWAAGTDCSDVGDVCAGGVCMENSACTSGQTRCAGTVIQTCSGTGVWQSGIDCSDSSQTCSNGSCGGGGGVCADSGATARYYICDGTAVVACDALVEAGRWDCVDDLGTCYDYGGTFGADCLIPLGETCSYCTNDDCSEWYSVGCGTSTPDPTIGCDLFSGCSQLSSGCAPADPFAEYCDGNHLVVWCYDYVALDVSESIDCAAEGLGYGTCNAGHCEHATAGAMCNELVLCVGGLTCNSTSNECE